MGFRVTIESDDGKTVFLVSEFKDLTWKYEEGRTKVMAQALGTHDLEPVGEVETTYRRLFIHAEESVGDE